MTIRPLAKVLAWWLFWHPPAPVDADAWDGRILTRPCLHIGLRPHSDALGDVALTLQITTCTKW